MFYCDPCKSINQWPVSLHRSYGKCEMCGVITVLNDVQSKFLPSKKDTVTQKILDKINDNVMLTIDGKPTKIDLLDLVTKEDTDMPSTIINFTDYDGTKSTGNVYRVRGTDYKFYEYKTYTNSDGKYVYGRASKDLSSPLFMLPREWLSLSFDLPDGVAWIIDGDGQFWERVHKTADPDSVQWHSEFYSETCTTDELFEEYGISKLLGEIKK